MGKKQTCVLDYEMYGVCVFLYGRFELLFSLCNKMQRKFLFSKSLLMDRVVTVRLKGMRLFTLIYILYTIVFASAERPNQTANQTNEIPLH